MEVQLDNRAAAFFHDAAGCLLPDAADAEAGHAPLLLIARCGSMGLRADGTLVRLQRPAEWPNGAYGEWVEINGQALNLDQAVEVVEAAEDLFLLPRHTLDMENLWIACQMWALASQVHGAPLRDALERVQALEQQLAATHQLLCSLELPEESRPL
jgi:hypothetical protein